MKRKNIAITATTLLTASLMLSACGSSASSATATTVEATQDNSVNGMQNNRPDGQGAPGENGQDSPDGNSQGGPGGNGQGGPNGEGGQGATNGNEQGAPDGNGHDGPGGINGGGDFEPGNGQGGPGGNGQGGPGGMPGGNGQGGPGGMPGGGSSKPESYSAVNDITSDADLTGNIDSTGTDQNAVLVSNGAAVTIRNANITRNSSDSTGGDTSSFYGVGAAVLATDGTAYVSNSTITTDAKGGAGVFAYDKGVSYVADTTITTAKDTSGGIHVAGGGTLYAWNDTVTTNGESSAAIRSDRGGGKMVVDGGTYVSNGSGSPAVYSTADISINDATLTANGSEAICIEGDNQIRLFNCDLSGNMADLSQNNLTWNVILYQSMSGDSEVGNSTFEMDGGTLTAKNGGMFYSTNTQSTFTLKDVDITYAEDNDFFLRVTGNSNERGWGSTGANGADTTFTAISQDMEGNVIWDSISELDFYMTEGSTLKGAFVDDESDAGNGGNGYANVYIDSTSTWTVTGNSTVTNLYSEGKIVDASGKAVTIVDKNGNVIVSGDSNYTVTVTGDYKETGDLSGANKLSSWSDYKVTKPSQLS
ncbi:MAG: hypothetical protein K6A76_08125 [Oribacterium sp.]|nr:hypothetical protein [Oribacterium sp.]